MYLIKKDKLKYVLPAIPPALWGTGIGIAKYLLSSFTIDSVTLVYTRFFFTALLMLPLMIYFLISSYQTKTPVPKQQASYNLLLKDKKLIGILLIVAITISGVVVNNSIFYLGLEYTLASDSALIVGLSPIISIILANLIIKQPFKRNHLLGSVFGLLGVGLIIGLQIVDVNFSRLIGDLIIFCAITLWSSSFIFSKKASESGYSAFAITFYSIMIGVICMTPIIFMFENVSAIILLILNFRFLLAMLFYGLLSGALGYSLWYGNIQKLGPVETAIFLDSMPFWTILFSVLFLHEMLTIFHILGLLLISIGVVVVNKKDLFVKKLNVPLSNIEEVNPN